MCVCVCMCVCVWIRKLIPTVLRKVPKKSKFDECIIKVDVQHFSYVNLLQDFKFMKSALF